MGDTHGDFAHELGEPRVARSDVAHRAPDEHERLVQVLLGEAPREERHGAAPAYCRV